MAIINRRADADMIFHSDRVVQYASEDFRAELKLNKMIQSMSRKGNCWDNREVGLPTSGIAESFFSIQKNEMKFNVFWTALKQKNIPLTS